jgi:hypothetical protein
LAGREFAGNYVDPQFLDTMGMRLVRGRNFQPGEDNVALISEAAERVIWPARDSLGKPLPWGSPGTIIIGVVRNASTNAVGHPEPLEFYVPQTRAEALDSVLLLRVAGQPHDAVRRLQDAARALDTRLQPSVQVLTDAYDHEVQNASQALAVVTLLGTVAVLLSAIGLAGLAGYTVAQRTREIGLRIALGARAGQVIRAILAPMSRPVVVGFVTGAIGGSAVARVLQSAEPAMAGMRLFDPVAYLLAMAFFTVVVGLAILAPGRRAIRIDPGKALQHE